MLVQNGALVRNGALPQIWPLVRNGALVQIWPLVQICNLHPQTMDL